MVLCLLIEFVVCTSTPALQRVGLEAAYFPDQHSAAPRARDQIFLARAPRHTQKSEHVLVLHRIFGSCQCFWRFRSFHRFRCRHRRTAGAQLYGTRAGAATRGDFSFVRFGFAECAQSLCMASIARIFSRGRGCCSMARRETQRGLPCCGWLQRCLRLTRISGLPDSNTAKLIVVSGLKGLG